MRSWKKYKTILVTSSTDPIENAKSSFPVINQEIITVSMVPTILQLSDFTTLRAGLSDITSVL